MKFKVTRTEEFIIDLPAKTDAEALRIIQAAPQQYCTMENHWDWQWICTPYYPFPRADYYTVHCTQLLTREVRVLHEDCLDHDHAILCVQSQPKDWFHSSYSQELGRSYNVFGVSK